MPLRAALRIQSTLMPRATTDADNTNTNDGPAPPGSLAALEGLGPARVKGLLELGITSPADLLTYFPRDYRYETGRLQIAELRGGDDIQTARGEVVAVNYSAGRRPRFEATLDDGTGKLALTFFNAAYLRTRIHPGKHIEVTGKVSFFRSLPQMVNPKWVTASPEGDGGALAAGSGRLRPVYPASSRLSTDVIARLIEDNLPRLTAGVVEYFDDALLARRRLMKRRDAFAAIHCPPTRSAAIAARRRLIFDELMVMQLGLGIARRQTGSKLTAPILRVDKLVDQRIRARFPFELTRAQQHAIWEVLSDMQSGRPMNRLLQGDVGSGKTSVALYAMLVAVANRMQAALLAPTEVLAEQHYLTLSRFLAGSSVAVELFTQRTRKASRGSLFGALSDGRINLAVGTQALLQEDIEFANLGLVVVDEQHRLGVRQRATIRSKGLLPHYLVMTATPIPRTLALSYFADFDMSIIDELPPGRQAIETRWITGPQAGKAYEFIRRQVGEGRQAYIVLPQINAGGSDGSPIDTGAGESASVTAEFKRLGEGPLSGLRLTMLHGQMSTEEKQRAMADFREGRADVLVATTVIEVGVDVPNATVMLIGSAERFGLSQLHQLRGRVGRGSHTSYCLLLSDAQTESASARLSAMCATASGFEIAEMDLKLRGPGEFFGTRQHGLPEFKLADVTEETELLYQAKEDALALLETDPRLSLPQHRALRDALIAQFGDSLPLAQVG